MIFNIQDIHRQLPITGIVHIGAYVADEVHQYRGIGLTNTIFFEPQRNLCEIIKQKLLPTESVYNVALGSKKCTHTMYLSQTEGGIARGSGQSSSLLKPKIHLLEHPQVKFEGEIEVDVHTLDSYSLGKEYNFLNADVQGYELEVLKGSVQTLNQIDGMILEVNRHEMYENCPLINEIDEFLSSYNFKRVYQVWQSQGWGDAIYVKNKD